jgi:hypothetical protein
LVLIGTHRAATGIVVIAVSDISTGDSILTNVVSEKLPDGHRKLAKHHIHGGVFIVPDRQATLETR